VVPVRVVFDQTQLAKKSGGAMANEINQSEGGIRVHRTSDFDSFQGQFPFISWRAVLAGIFVTLLTYATLMALGLAFGGLALNQVIENREGAGLPTGAAIWFVLSTLISLFAGSYFAGRVSNFSAPRIGGAQGLVIAAVFFVLFLTQLGITLGWAGSSIAGAVGSAGRAVGSQASNVARLMSNPKVQSLIDQAVGDLNLRSDPEVVAQGLATRLITGDPESAKNYLARQAGISPTEADRRINDIRTDFVAAAESTAKSAANVLMAAGWALFGMLLLGTLAACSGGALGSRENSRHPILRRESVEDYQPAPARI